MLWNLSVIRHQSRTVPLPPPPPPPPFPYKCPPSLDNQHPYYLLDNWPPRQLPLDNYPADDCLPRQLPPRKLPPYDNCTPWTVAPTRMFIPSYAYKEISLFLFPKWLFLLPFWIRGLCKLRYFSSKYLQSITQLKAPSPDSLPNPNLTLKQSKLHATWQKWTIIVEVL